MTLTECERCGVTTETEDIGVVLYDDHVMLDYPRDDVLLCTDCEDEFVKWLKNEIPNLDRR